MKLDYSEKFTDKKGSAIIRGKTANGWNCFVRRETIGGKPITWEQYTKGCLQHYAVWNPINENCVKVMKI